MAETSNTADFEAFYRRNCKYVYRLCFSYMSSKEEAEDITEDLFVKVLSEGIRFNDENHERKWLTIAAANMCKNRLKSWEYNKVRLFEEADENIARTDSVYDDTLDVILKLPEKYKTVILMHYYMGYKTDEIAGMIKKPAATVRWRLMRAKNMLRKLLTVNSSDDVN